MCNNCACASRTPSSGELVTYVVDVFGLRLTSEKSTIVEDGAYSGLQLWRFLQLRYFVDSFSSGSTLGRPSLFAAGAKTEFAGFNAAIVLRRDFGIFIVKTLMPAAYRWRRPSWLKPGFWACPDRCWAASDAPDRPPLPR